MNNYDQLDRGYPKKSIIFIFSMLLIALCYYTASNAKIDTIDSNERNPHCYCSANESPSDEKTKECRNNVSTPCYQQLDILTPDNIFTFKFVLYTIWITLLLVTPAFATVLFIRKSAVMYDYWLLFWTASLATMIIHMYVAIDGFFHWDWDHIFNKTDRVDRPKENLVLTAWWIIDVFLGWVFYRSNNKYIHLQRILVHIFAFIFFYLSFITKGDSEYAEQIGYASLILVVIFWLYKWRSQDR